MAAGCINMNVPKLHFTLDDAGNPVGVKLYPYLDSNRLIEEFMLLSNMAVARRISASFPDTSLLRIHPPPAAGTLATVSQFCGARDLPTPQSFSSIDMQQVSCQCAALPKLLCINNVPSG
jgi:exoribonuclease R